MLRKISQIVIIVLMFILTISSYSQAETQTDSMETYNSAAGVTVFLLVAFMFIIILVLSAAKYENTVQRKDHVSLFTKLSRILNRGVPVEKEDEIKMDHGFDGIFELNNRIPPWFNILFYGTILFAGVYLLDYHVFGSGTIMLDEYTQEVRIAAEKREELIRTGAFINENNVTLLKDAENIDKGKQIFTVNCIACHGPDGGGTVGPNLTDKNWIHGGGIKNIFKTIKNGVPPKGMIAWQTMLNPKQMQQVASYVIALQGTKPSIAKAPEGQEWIDEEINTVQQDSTKVNIDSTKIIQNKK